ncbi:hypothetical protein [Phaeospirillum tilakii]|uniref:Uncharacterized protein n=1 Tax=Phaeospirillum tilakii TaxID=741673 RepID=A0ABW5CAJ7_9PROT
MSPLRRPAGLIGRALLLLAGFQVLLLGLATLGSGLPPTTIRIHSWADNVRIVLTHTPRFGLAVPVALREPLLEIRHVPVDSPVPDWSLHLVPAHLAAEAALALLTVGYFRRRRAPLPATLIGGGIAAAALASSTLAWTVCCASPSWAVALALAGLDPAIALVLVPFGPVVAGAGLAAIAIGFGVDAVSRHKKYTKPLFY